MVCCILQGKAILEQSHEELKNRFTNTLYLELMLKTMTESDRSNLISDLNKSLDDRTNVQYELAKLPRNKLQYKLTYTSADPSEIEYVISIE